MSTKIVGIILIVAGVLVILAGLFAGYIGLSHTTAIGTNKIILAAVGLVVGIVGAVLTLRKPAA